MNPDLDRFLSRPVFAEVDRRFAAFIDKEDGRQGYLVGAAAALASYQLRRGHVFLDLTREPAWENPAEAPLTEWPLLEEWIESLKSSPVVGVAGDLKPMLLTPGGKLYLQRYWYYEQLLAKKLRERARVETADLSGPLVERLDELFHDVSGHKEAARNALTRQFSLISGGPGTGKTTAVLKILILMLEREPGLSIKLAAPTGKAAARMQESIREGLAKLQCPQDVRARLEEQQASTIHRLLGSISGSVFFRHNARNPLAADVVVIDEASMVDLPLMAKLVEALPSGCRLIVLGDKDQLASVEAGSVLGGIVEAAVNIPGKGRAAPLAGSVTLLNENFRFGNESAIYLACNAVRDGDATQFLEITRSASGSEVTMEDSPAPHVLKKNLRPFVVNAFSRLLKAEEPETALAAIGRFQILTPLRSGPYGKENINYLVEQILWEEGLIPPGGKNFSGRPIMVTENDYAVRLFNGDVGIYLEDEEGRLMAFFRSEEGRVRKIPPLRLPFTEGAFAMTIHKSQGSEFDEALIILPHSDNPVLTRELLYTAISRARKRVHLWGGEEILRKTVGRKISRASGLVEMLQ